MRLKCGCIVTDDKKQIIKMCYDHYRIMSGGIEQKPEKKLFGLFRTDVFKDPRNYAYFMKRGKFL